MSCDNTSANIKHKLTQLCSHLPKIEKLQKHDLAHKLNCFKVNGVQRIGLSSLKSSSVSSSLVRFFHFTLCHFHIIHNTLNTANLNGLTYCDNIIESICSASCYTVYCINDKSMLIHFAPWPAGIKWNKNAISSCIITILGFMGHFGEMYNWVCLLFRYLA